MKKILVIDDDRLLLKALENSLKELGYATYTATNGEEAMERFSRDKMDLVICDLMMPKMSGISFICELIYNFESNIPVVLISSFRSGKQIADSSDYKNIVFLPKPFSFQQMLDTVKKLTS
jgi:DNA-binding NtrC family response regulator